MEISKTHTSLGCEKFLDAFLGPFAEQVTLLRSSKRIPPSVVGNFWMPFWSLCRTSYIVEISKTHTFLGCGKFLDAFLDPFAEQVKLWTTFCLILMILDASERCKFRSFTVLLQIRPALLGRLSLNSIFFCCFFSPKNQVVIRRREKCNFSVCSVQALLKEHNFIFQKVLASEFA